MESFLCDSMLGDVLRWLRILGFEAHEPRQMGLRGDLDVVEACAEGNYTLLTRDRELAARALKRGVKVLLVPQDRIERVLAWLSAEAGVRLEFDPDRSRCPECGGELEVAGGARTVPPGAPRDRKVYVCRSCGKAYWEGRQTANMRETLSRAAEIAESLKIGDGGV